MFRRILVPVDHSEYSIRAAELGILLARAFGGVLVGAHVYAAGLHDLRFKQMEFTLPSGYQEERTIERQRKVHDALISKGLTLISDSYLDPVERRCLEEKVPFERKIFDGKNFKVLAQEIGEGGYDLVVMGALGMGASKDSFLGSVTERTARRIRTDLLVVRDCSPLERQEGKILVAIDGSPQSFGGLKDALAIGKALNRPVEAVAVYDPYFHQTVFNSISGVLSEKASKVFRFREQEKLHTEIIDTGLAKIYRSHLEIARRVSEEEGMPIQITLLDGRGSQRILDYVRDEKPWLLVLGRIGVHSDQEMDLGSTTENLLRLAPCHCLVVSRSFVPPLELQEEERFVWTEEASARIGRIPPMIREMARKAILHFASERGHTMMTSQVIDEALQALFPSSSHAKNQPPPQTGNRRHPHGEDHEESGMMHR